MYRAQTHWAHRMLPRSTVGHSCVLLPDITAIVVKHEGSLNVVRKRSQLLLAEQIFEQRKAPDS